MKNLLLSEEQIQFLQECLVEFAEIVQMNMEEVNSDALNEENEKFRKLEELSSEIERQKHN